MNATGHQPWCRRSDQHEPHGCQAEWLAATGATIVLLYLDVEDQPRIMVAVSAANGVPGGSVAVPVTGRYAPELAGLLRALGAADVADAVQDLAALGRQP